MSTSNDSDTQGTSTRPYLIRALHEWCTDNGFTPYLAVYVDRAVQVPQEYVKNNEIVLNVSFEATSQLQMGNEFVEFKARFGGVSREIRVPVDHVIAIYARENGQGMAFPVPSAPQPTDEAGDEGVSQGGPEDADRAGPLRLARTPRGGAGASSGPKDRAESAKAGQATPGAEEGKGGTGGVGKKPSSPVSIVTSGEEDPPDSPPPGGGRPSLRRVK